MNQKVIRIVALVLAVIMAGGVLIVAFSNLAGAVDATTLAASPATGTEGVPKAPVIIGIVAVLVAVACVIIPKAVKK
ncbi:MAG: hypothetical protein IKH12_03580 [Clostridia bacterium]|nr:hypothetical protein [Clostridia bacterium]